MCKKLLHLTPVALVLALLLGNMASAGLIAHWPLDGHYGDATGNGHDGTPLGDPEFVSDLVRELVLEVDGDGDRILIEDAPDLNYGADESLTMTAWVLYDPSLRSAGWKCALSKGRTGTGGDTSYLEEVYAFYISAEGNWHANAGGLWGDTVAAVPGEWDHLAFVQNADEGQCFFYVGLQEVVSGSAASCDTPGRPFFIGAGGTDGVSGFEPFGGRISDVRIYNEALAGGALAATTLPLTPGLAHDPLPNDQATDVPLDAALGWKPGDYANTHDVYFGLNFDDVNDATKASPEYETTKSLGDESYAPEALDFGTTYYWRVDEVNAPTDAAVFKGEVWQFTTEPVAYPIADVTATASSFAAGQGPEKTINGSGLNANDLHSTESTSMWLSEDGGAQPTWIRYDFDRIYKLHQMWVWNYNVELESVVGFGLNDVTIEYSTDGSNWTPLEGAAPFAQAPGTGDCAHNTTIDFAGALAKSVRLTANSNHGPFDQYGLSEVRFLYVPGWAREPDPQDGATGIHPDVVLRWRAGREATTHDLYLSTDEQGVIDGTVAANTVTEASYDAGTLELAQTYHWRVDEVNEAGVPAIWQGDIWSFETAAYLVVDDFEGYDDDYENYNRVFQVWIDGAGYTQPEPGHAGNGSGSLVGTAQAPWVESTIVHSGRQAVPISYNNMAAPFYSEAVRSFAVPQNWAKAGIETLTLSFYGNSTNSAGEKMYVKINGVKVPYDGDSSNLTQGIWQPWTIKLSSLVGANLQNVTEFAIGFSGSGSGVVTFDDIRLNPAPRIPEVKAPDDTSLVAHWDFEGDFTDATGKGHDGLAFGEPTIVNDPLRGQVLEVDGDDHVGVSDAPDLNYGPDESLTLAAWVNFGSAGAPAGWKCIVAKGRTELGGGAGYVDEFYGFYVSPTNNWQVNAGGIAGQPFEAAGGQWHHLAFVQDGPAGEGHFYIDGEVVISGGADSCDTTGRPLFIGAAGTDVSVFEAFKGRIDDVRIYSYALSEPEIQYLVAGLKAPDDTALVAHWDFEGDFTDATGKGHDGLAFAEPTIVNDPLRGQVLEVDGDDRVGVSDAPDLNFGADESLTLTAWANFGSADAPQGWKCIVAKGRTELGGGADYLPELYGFYVSPENSWNVNAGGIGGAPLAAAGGQWHHLAFVQNAPVGEGRFYIDGEVVISGGVDSCDTTGRPLFIGAAGTDVSIFEPFKGRIDDVRIYNYALSQLEIQYLVFE